MRTPGEFAAAVFGERLPEGRLIATWSLDDKKSRWWRSAQGLDYLAGRPNTFIGVSLAAKDYGTRQRLKANRAAGIAGLWLDLDVVGGPEDRDHGAPSKDEALAVGSAVLPPTLVVDSGWGNHTWHLLPKPWLLNKIVEQQRASNLAARWYALHAQIAAHRGWHLDQSTRDLARIMRLPGTVNAKGGQKAPVTVLDADGPRYELDVLEAQADDIELPHEQPARIAPGTDAIGDLSLRIAEPPQGPLAALLANSLEFQASFYRQRYEFLDDDSRYDQSLADFAVQAGWTDQDIAALIGCARGWDHKSFRRDYIVRTLHLARHHDGEYRDCPLCRGEHAKAA
jgi:hypothetical protein